MIRRVLDDVGLDRRALEGIEVLGPSVPLDPAPWGAHEVLLVSGDADRLAAAGAVGINRLVATEPGATTAALGELCGELDRP